MKCRDVRELTCFAQDGYISETELRELERHIRFCPDCALEAHQLQGLRAALRSLTRPVPPPDLTTKLRVVASRHSAELDRQGEFCNSLTYWLDVIRVWTANLMRPVAVPAAGGLAIAVLLFSMVIPTFTVNASEVKLNDVPTMLATEASLTQPFISYGAIENDIVVEVLVDGTGRMMDYAVPEGQVWQNDPELRRCIESTLLCTQFSPATMFGQPTSGRVRVTVRGNSVEVIG